MTPLTTCRSLLIFGGTFDPPHVAHVALPAMVRDLLGMDLLAYVPAAQSPLKSNRTHTPARHRLAMIRLATAHDHRCIVLTDELDRARSDTPSYTVDTLQQLRLRLGPEVKMRLLIGADQMRLFHRWREHDTIAALAEPVVMLRPPETAQALLSELPDAQQQSVWKARLVELPLMDVSSTAIRQRLGNGLSVSGLVPSSVLDYIRQHGLYATEMKPGC